MFDLTIQFREVDLTVSAKAMLKIVQLIQELPVGIACVVGTEVIPFRIAPHLIKIAPEPASGFTQPPDALHVDFPMRASNACRLISMSARSRA